MNFKEYLRQSLNEMIGGRSLNQGLHHRGIESSSAPTTPPQGSNWNMPGHLNQCPPGSECSPCGKAFTTHCSSKRKAGAGCWYIWVWTEPDPDIDGPAAGGGWGESMICADDAGGGGGAAFGGGV